jgi:hypothetical protein
MDTEKIKALFRKFQDGDAPPRGELDRRYYEIRVDQSGRVEIHWQNTVYQITGNRRLRVQVLNDRAIKSCQKCGTDFIPNKFTPYQKYCRNCGSHAPKPDLEEVKCSQCGRMWSRSKFNPYKEVCSNCIKANLKAWEKYDKFVDQPVCPEIT